MTTKKCELCSMDATQLKADDQGLMHYYCDHHAPSGATKIGGITKNPVSAFTPLIVIFGIIILHTVLAVYHHGSWDLMFAMRNFEGAFFIIFGAFKLLNLKRFVDAYQTYDIVAKKSRFYAYIYPFIELAIGIAFLTSFNLLLTNIVTLVLMVIGSIGVARALRDKNEIPCACLGVVFKIPMTKVTLIEDVLMGVMAIIMIILSM